MYEPRLASIMNEERDQYVNKANNLGDQMTKTTLQTSEQVQNLAMVFSRARATMRAWKAAAPKDEDLKNWKYKLQTAVSRAVLMTRR